MSVEPLTRLRAWLLIAFAVTISAFAIGAALFAAGRPIAPPPQAVGAVSILVDDREVSTKASEYLTLDTGLAKLADRPISLRVRFTGQADQTVGWALVLGQDFALDWNAPMSGTAMATQERRPLDLPWASGANTASYVRNAAISASGDASPRMLGSVLVGTIKLKDGHGDITFAVPASVALASDVGGRVVLNLPTLGLPFSEPTLFSQRDNLHSEADPQTLAVGTARQEEVPPDLLAQVNRPTWWFPSQADFELEIDAAGPEQRLEAAVPPPLSNRPWVWQANGRLEVEATMEDPSEQASRNGSLFVAGLMLGVAGGALVWFLDLIRQAFRSRKAPSTRGEAGEED
jgi:hypothetical protein